MTKTGLLVGAFALAALCTVTVSTGMALAAPVAGASNIAALSVSNSLNAFSAASGWTSTQLGTAATYFGNMATAAPVPTVFS
ncbi:MAG: hypothetical protein OEY94_01005 [Alphaproteobacteria bacterium]|nr:hypothetical protein [Alphaproteobacteria bacterium]